MAKRRVPDPIRQVKLEFSGSPHESDDPLHKDLSAVARVGDCLFVAADEAAKIKRLIRSREALCGRRRRLSRRRLL